MAAVFPALAACRRGCKTPTLKHADASDIPGWQAFWSGFYNPSYRKRRGKHGRHVTG
jgi:hypothetical protein